MTTTVSDITISQLERVAAVATLRLEKPMTPEVRARYADKLWAIAEAHDSDLEACANAVSDRHIARLNAVERLAMRHWRKSAGLR